MATIKDIAKVCHVSASTVSKALNGYGDIGAETVKLVQETARKMNYHPDAAARLLKTNRSYSIGIVFADGAESGLTHEYFSHILNSAKNAVEARGYDVTFISNRIGGSSYLDHCRYRKVDGVLIACIKSYDPQVLELVNSEIPVVTIDFPFEGRSCIFSDNEHDACTLMRYILSKGHRDIAIIHGEMTEVTEKRLRGFRQALDQYHVTIPEENILEGRYHNIESVSECVVRLLEREHRPETLLFPDDYSAIGCRSLFDEKHLRIPDDISIAGYDGVDVFQSFRPALTTLHQDAEGIGRAAGSQLIDEIEHKVTGPKHITIGGCLYPGETIR